VSGNTFGKIFKVTTFGESHGPATGCVVDGCPAGLELELTDILSELARRRPGSGGASTTRKEDDNAEILSGVFEGKTLGTPIAILIRNKSHNSRDYDELKDIYRPGHADWTYEAKYGRRDHNGGGRSSARETAGRVAAGAVAKRLLAENNIFIRAWTAEIAGITAPGQGQADFDLDEAEKNNLHVPSAAVAACITEKIAELRLAGESAGGIVACTVTGLPAGLGEPVFEKIDALIAGAMLSLGAAKGIEFGSGFASARLLGSESNDTPLPCDLTNSKKISGGGGEHPAGFGPRGFGDRGSREGGLFPKADNVLPPHVPQLLFASNRAGGVLGGISNGAPLEFRVAFKPVPSISKQQRTVDRSGVLRELCVKGRHDICVCPRAVSVVEAMTALVLADLLLQQRCVRLFP
jgi:chorismate synthase